MTSQQLQEGLADCWCRASETELVTPTPDHVMSSCSEMWQQWTAVGCAIRWGFTEWLEVLLQHQAPFCFAQWAHLPLAAAFYGRRGGFPALAFALSTRHYHAARLCVAHGADPLTVGAKVKDSAAAILAAPARHAVAATRFTLWMHKFGSGNDLLRRVDRHVWQYVAQLVYCTFNDPVWRFLCHPDRDSLN
jgi:hypothetical protein